MPRSLFVGVVTLLVGASSAGFAVQANAGQLPPALVAPPVKKPLLRVHKAKSLKTVPSRPAGGTAPAAASNHGPTSPYARASAERADSGLPPPGHAQVLQRDPVAPASKPAQ